MGSLARPQVTVGAGLTTLLGGARSGKSDLAVDIGCRWGGDVVFVATAEPHDKNMAERIAKHQVERPKSWETVEKPLFAASDLSSLNQESCIVIDCLTLLVSNLLLAGESDEVILSHVGDLVVELKTWRAPAVVVSNEVGLGVHPATELGARYRDTLGKVNCLVAAHSSAVLLIFAGRVLPLADVQLSIEPQHGGENR